MKNIIYKGYNLSLNDSNLTAENRYIILTGRWQQLKKAIDKIHN